MTCSHSLESFRFQVLDQDGMVDPVGQLLSNDFGLLDLVFLAIAQAVVLRLDELNEKGCGGVELLKVLTQLAILDHLLLQSILHNLVMIHDSVLEVQAKVKHFIAALKVARSTEHEASTRVWEQDGLTRIRSYDVLAGGGPVRSGDRRGSRHRDRDENQPEPSPIWDDVTTAERSHAATGTVEASEITGLVGVEVPTSKVGIA
uniref:Uncharacterized protein n=1 Tax=Peronospora matthiolae TaxID=2874970 RepID=A0AAV1TLX3_9STRA